MDKVSTRNKKRFLNCIYSTMYSLSVKDFETFNFRQSNVYSRPNSICTVHIYYVVLWGTKLSIFRLGCGGRPKCPPPTPDPPVCRGIAVFFSNSQPSTSNGFTWYLGSLFGTCRAEPGVTFRLCSVCAVAKLHRVISFVVNKSKCLFSLSWRAKSIDLNRIDSLARNENVL